MKILVTGSSGAGKTYFAQEFKKMSINAFDSDLIPNLDSWYYKEEKVSAPEIIDKEFLDNHSFLWNRKVLEEFLQNHPDVIIFGMSGNAFEMRDLFDKVYFLKVPPKIINVRVQHESRENPMGKTEEQWTAVLEWGAMIEKEARKLGFEFIDGTLAPKELLNILGSK